jgi:hypothetical protein
MSTFEDIAGEGSIEQSKSKRLSLQLHGAQLSGAIAKRLSLREGSLRSKFTAAAKAILSSHEMDRRAVFLNRKISHTELIGDVPS